MLYVYTYISDISTQIDNLKVLITIYYNGMNSFTSQYHFNQ